MNSTLICKSTESMQVLHADRYKYVAAIKRKDGTYLGVVCDEGRTILAVVEKESPSAAHAMLHASTALVDGSTTVDRTSYHDILAGTR